MRSHLATFEQVELEAVRRSLNVNLTKLRRLVEETEDRDVRHRVRNLVIRLSDVEAEVGRVL